MPNKPQPTKTAGELNSVQVLKTTLNEMPQEFSSMLPQIVQSGDILPNGARASSADSLQSLRAIGDIVMQFQPIQNAFLTNIVNRIVRVIITSKLYDNPWAGFKKGILEYGETVEEIFVSLAKPYQFDPGTAENELFKRRIPDVKVAFHSMNYQKFYPTTVSNDQLRQAFLSWQGITDLISRIIEQVYTGANYDEFLVMKYMIAKASLKGEIYAKNIAAPSTDTARAITTEMVNSAKLLKYMSNTYNYANVTTYTDIKDLYMILTTNISSLFDVEVLALSFNMNKAELLGRQVEVDGFGNFDNERLALIFADDPNTTFTPFTTQEIALLNSIQGFMVDKDWFMIFDNFYNMTEVYNAQGLYWNYFYHVWKTFSISPFSNAILFTTQTPQVNSVTVTPATATLAKGGTLQLSAVVDTAGFAPKNVTWSVNSSVATINSNGLLTVPASESATSLTVTATSDFDGSKKGTSTITLS